MKIISTFGLFLLVSISYALAAGNTEVEGLGPMTAFFISFGVMIVLYQFIPGFMLFAAMLKRILPSSAGKFSETGKNKYL